MAVNLAKKKWIDVLLLVIIVVLGAAVYFSFARSDRILDKYKNHKDFEVVAATLHENLRFIENNPNNDSAYYSLGQGLYSMQGYDDAIWAFREAVRIAPDKPYYWSFLGTAYQAKKDYPNARDAYIRALEIEPEKPINYVKLAWLYYFRLEPEKNKAFEVLQGGLERFPNNKELLFDITRYYMYDQNREEFLKYAPRYLQIDPNNEPIKKAYEDWRE